MVTANQVDIDAGKLAVATSHTKDVNAFGQLMITDHTGVNKSAVALVTKLKVTPEDNPTSQSLKSGGDENLANLKSLKGAAFNKAYIDHEVAYQRLRRLPQGLPSATQFGLPLLPERTGFHLK